MSVCAFFNTVLFLQLPSNCMHTRHRVNMILQPWILQPWGIMLTRWRVCIQLLGNCRKRTVLKKAHTDINKGCLIVFSHCLPLLLLLHFQITRSDLHWCMCRDIHICRLQGLEFNWEGCSTAGAKSRCSRKH